MEKAAAIIRINTATIVRSANFPLKRRCNCKSRRRSDPSPDNFVKNSCFFLNVCYDNAIAGAPAYLLWKRRLKKQKTETEENKIVKLPQINPTQTAEQIQKTIEPLPENERPDKYGRF